MRGGRVCVVGGAGFQGGFAAASAWDADARDVVALAGGGGDFFNALEVGFFARDAEDFADLPPAGDEEIDVGQQALEDGAGFGEGPEFFAVVEVEARGDTGGAGGFQRLAGGGAGFGGEARVDAARVEPARTGEDAGPVVGGGGRGRRCRFPGER